MENSKDKPLVSIIIVNYNGKEHLEKCLKSLLKINYANYEIILVDNNSTDQSVEFVKNNFSSIMIIKLDKNYGFAEPNNIGAKNAKGKFLLFLNNDTKVTENFVNEMIDVINSDEKIAICQSLLLKPDGTVDSGGDFLDIYGRAYSLHTKPITVKPILSARGASMMIRKDAFEKLGGFDKNFVVSFEDVDIGWRAWILGYKVVIAPKSIVYHLAGKTIAKLIEETQFHGSKNTLVIRIVNFEMWYALKSVITLFFVTFMKRIFGISIIADPENPPPLPPFKIVMKAVAWVIKNWNYVSIKRKKLQTERKRSTKELIQLGLISSSFPYKTSEYN